MRVVSFNLGGARGEDGRGDPDRLVDALGGLAHDGADVLALQEVDRAQPRSHRVDQSAVAAEALGVAGDAHVRFEPSLWGTPGTPTATGVPGDPDGPVYGIALASRLPVRSWHRVDLPYLPVSVPVPAGAAAPGRRPGLFRLADEPRVGLAAVLEDPAPVATVLTTHLSFVPGVNAWQLRRLAAAVRDLPRPLLLLGDLNLPAAVPPTLLPDWRSFAGAATFPAPAPRWCLDQALLDGRPPAAVATHVVRTGVSDHRALVVDLHERPGGPQR